MKNIAPPKPNLRRCVACRQMYNRQNLVRLVYDRSNNQVTLYLPDQTVSIASGRSAYVCPTQTCVRGALKGKKLQKALKTSIPDDIVKYLNDLLKGTVPRGSSESPNL